MRSSHLEGLRCDYSQLSPRQIADLFRLAEKYLLTDRQLVMWANIKTKREAHAKRVTRYLADIPSPLPGVGLSEKSFLRKYGKNEDKHPVDLPRTKWLEIERVFARHDWAKKFMAWYWRQPASRRLIRRARRA